MLSKVSQVLAYIAHPVFTPFYLTALLSQVCASQFPASVGELFLVTVVVPIAILFMMKQWNWISSFSEMNLKERRLTLAISGVYYLIWMMVVRDTAFGALCASIVLCHFFLYIYSHKQKPSLHTYSWIGGGIVLFGSNQMLCAVPAGWIIGWLVFCAFIIASRLYLRAHTVKEVVMASIIASVSVFLVFLTHYGI